MTRNEARFGVIGTIGSGSELRPLPRKNPTNSYHAVIDGEEKLIRYDYSFIPPSLAYKKNRIHSLQADSLAGGSRSS